MPPWNFHSFLEQHSQVAFLRCAFMRAFLKTCFFSKTWENCPQISFQIKIINFWPSIILQSQGMGWLADGEAEHEVSTGGGGNSDSFLKQTHSAAPTLDTLSRQNVCLNLLLFSDCVLKTLYTTLLWLLPTLRWVPVHELLVPPQKGVFRCKWRTGLRSS